MKARWHGEPYHDYKNKVWLITFESSEQPTIYDETKDEELTVEVKKYRPKRSLTANAYFHVLVGKIAEKMETSHAEIHNMMIAR